MNKMTSFLLALGLTIVPLAFAHTGTDPNGDKSVPGPNPSCWTTQNPHDYTANGENQYYSVASIQGSHARYVAWDGNACGAAFDGDFEWGNGGGFFPAGPWAEICGYVDHHWDNVHVHDAITQPNDGTGLHEAVFFAVGADPTPPIIVSNPEGGTSCIDDGCVCIGDLDPDDWLQYCLHKCDLSPPADNTNPAFGQPGGKGGYEVWVYCTTTTDGGWEGALIRLGTTDANGDGIPDDTNGDGIPDANPSVQPITPPTTAGATCSLTGHIYFPNTWPGKTW